MKLFAKIFMASIMRDKDYCLILAAGFGTRMGAIGKVLPKVMWPVFHKSLLELQVLFAKSLGYKNIFINIHHQAPIILEMTRDNPNFKEVVWLFERPEILDIGGGIHNLARQKDVQYSGTLLVLNADQIFWFTKNDLDEWKKRLEKRDSILLSLKVNSSHGYNALLVENDVLIGIRNNKDIPGESEILTYSGNALISLDRLSPKEGPSKFFDSVCSFDKNNECIDLSHIPYWDFGTKDRYYQSLIRILMDKDHVELKSFYDFLYQSGVFRPELAAPQTQSYNSTQKGAVNLSRPDARIKSSGVLISGDELPVGTNITLAYQNIFDYLN